MKLHEYQSKRIFARYGVPIPQGDVASTPEQARHIAARLGKRVVIKSQVLVGGRGKAGGIKLAKSAHEADSCVETQVVGRPGVKRGSVRGSWRDAGRISRLWRWKGGAATVPLNRPDWT